MKENILEILSFIFEQFSHPHSKDTEKTFNLIDGLKQKGFSKDGIAKAFEWLINLNRQILFSNKYPSNDSIRIFAAEENKINAECRGMLLTLEQLGVLTPKTREIVINQLLEFDDNDLDLIELKWVVLMVLLNQPNGPEKEESLQKYTIITKDDWNKC
jgi:Smg protein